ncbi:hypothetical protein MIR68_004056 [Amoeboaphelidium protococcarum]|nr:hypothetical protein MIR68_004056 [Amoeboaphelidium protococcarum]
MSNHSDPIHGCWPPHIQQLLCISTLNDTHVIIHYIVHNRGDDWELVGDTFTGGSSLQLSAPVTRADKRLLVVAYQMLSAHPQRLHPRPLDSAWSLQALSSDQLVGVSLRGKGVLQDRAYGAGCAQYPGALQALQLQSVKATFRLQCNMRHQPSSKTSRERSQRSDASRLDDCCP